MPWRDRRSLILFAVGALSAYAAAILSMGVLSKIVSPEYAPLASVFIGLSTFFVTVFLTLWERFSLLEQAVLKEMAETQKLVVDEITRQKVGRFQTFDNTSDALQYEFPLIPRARKIWNTRFIAQNRHDLFGARQTLTDRQDQLVAQALVHNHCHYELIIAEESKEEVNQFAGIVKGLHQRRKEKSDGEASGEFGVWTLPTDRLPMIQMFILELADGSREALVGWLHSDKRSLRPSVVLFRDQEIARFFLGLYEIYKDRAEPHSLLAIAVSDEPTAPVKAERPTRSADRPTR